MTHPDGVVEAVEKEEMIQENHRYKVSIDEKLIEKMIEEDWSDYEMPDLDN